MRAEIAELLAELLADIVIDVEVVARELNLRDAMRERLRRALDRLDCAQAVSSSMRAMAAGIEEEEAVREAAHTVQMLAAEWPGDYPEEAAAEWRCADREMRTA
ncbi:hypothetical protein [Caballeronia sp. LZ043]|uniref:hypothetical protein n=1 Tax=Caballeronia sp. LZ043 TaxID=3038569 RepID=UPI002865982B|nr:hypothetical protein [Caballeronia sp. LZ043]MDR5819303.1 hypothetical protein [Caballeronia sp. LZ043]